MDDDYAYCKELIHKLNNQVFDMHEMKKNYSRSTKSVEEKYFVQWSREIMAKVNQIVKKGNMLINDLQKNVLKINDEFNKQKEKDDPSNAIMCADITRKANNTVK